MQFGGAKNVNLHHQLILSMERITILIRTSKKEGDVRLRFRLRDGRKVQLYHKSDIVASLQDMSKFNDDGSLRPRVAIYNKELQKEILSEISLVHQAYSNIRYDKDVTSERLEREIYNVRHPAQDNTTTLLGRMLTYIEKGYRDGLFKEQRKRHYMVVYHILERFLIINDNLDITPENFSPNMVMDFSLFVRDEYEYVDNWRGLYAGCVERNVPAKARSRNTVATKMKYLHAFFHELEDCEDIEKSPFHKLGKDRKRIILRERYDDPIYLRIDEFRKVLETDVPLSLQEVKDVFCLQCALGCRIGDFQSLTMDKVAIKDGIPYVHYLPHKTLRENKTFKEVETPLVKFAWDIVQRYKFSFKVLRYVSGKSGYNVKIKHLLEYCNIDRQCKVFDEDREDNIYKPLYELASSKLCRKTHVDIMNKVQINQYIAGLHREGSDAIKRYTKLELQDLFRLMCVAFGEQEYRIAINI